MRGTCSSASMSRPHFGNNPPDEPGLYSKGTKKLLGTSLVATRSPNTFGVCAVARSGGAIRRRTRQNVSYVGICSSRSNP